MMTSFKFHHVFQWDGHGIQLKINVSFSRKGSINTCVQYCALPCSIIAIWPVRTLYRYNLKLNRMSRDSLVSALPSNGWSCETLEHGIREAARMSGIDLKPCQLSEAGKYREMGPNCDMYFGHGLKYCF